MLEIFQLEYDPTCIQRYIDRLEAKDAYTKGHSHHVFVVTQAIIAELPINQRQQINEKMLYTAALLHDIGKITILDRILNKNDALTSEEWDIMKLHPVKGKELVQNTVFAPLGDWILYHHERIDGKGYYHIAGEEIPLESKIIAVADTFSALRTYRPYRAAKSILETKQIMMETADIQLDRELLVRFLSMDAEKMKTLRCNCEICQMRRIELGVDEDVEAV